MKIHGQERKQVGSGVFIASLEQKDDNREQRLHLQGGDVNIVLDANTPALVVDPDNEGENARFVVVVPPGTFYGIAFGDAETGAKVENILREHTSLRDRYSGRELRKLLRRAGSRSARGEERKEKKRKGAPGKGKGRRGTNFRSDFL